MARGSRRTPRSQQCLALTLAVRTANFRNAQGNYLFMRMKRYLKGSRCESGAAPQRYVETTSVTGTGCNTPGKRRTVGGRHLAGHVHEPEYLPRPEAARRFRTTWHLRGEGRSLRVAASGPCRLRLSAPPARPRGRRSTARAIAPNPPSFLFALNARGIIHVTRYPSRLSAHRPQARTETRIGSALARRSARRSPARRRPRAA